MTAIDQQTRRRTGRTGLTAFDPDRTCPGYVLYAPLAGPGDVVHIPPNAVHSTVALEDMETIYVKDTSWSLKGVPAGEQAPEAPPEDDPF